VEELKSQNKLCSIPTCFLFCDDVPVFKNIEELFSFNELKSEVSELLILEEAFVPNQVGMLKSFQKLFFLFDVSNLFQVHDLSLLHCFDGDLLFCVFVLCFKDISKTSFT